MFLSCFEKHRKKNFILWKSFRSDTFFAPYYKSDIQKNFNIKYK